VIAPSAKYLSGLEDANLFVLEMPNEHSTCLVVATLHPFNLDGRGYEARVYRLHPQRVMISPAAAAASLVGWGIDEINIYPDKSIELTRIESTRDENFVLRIWLSPPYVFDFKNTYLVDYTEVPNDSTPPRLLELLQSSTVNWKHVTLPGCEITHLR
jgi:hypothetical protein